MSKESKKLPESIKIVIDRYGKNVVNDVQMANIISDVVELEDGAAVKTILRDILSMGYGKKMLTIIPEKEDIHIKVKAFAKEISNNYGYKEVIVQYVLYSLAYGLGWISQTPYIKTHYTPKEKVKVKKESEEPLEIVPKKKIPFWTASIIAIILFFVVGYVFRYMAASEDREQFNQRIFSGDSFMYSGDYANAVESYKEAYNGYNAMNSGSYKDDALNSMNALNEKLLNDGRSNNKSLLEAYNTIKSELQLDLEKPDKEKLLKNLVEVESIIKERVENGHHQLISIISANNGKLDESGKILLEELLLLSPDDYWLNFIKKKSYE